MAGRIQPAGLFRHCEPPALRKAHTSIICQYTLYLPRLAVIHANPTSPESIPWHFKKLTMSAEKLSKRPGHHPTMHLLILLLLYTVPALATIHVTGDDNNPPAKSIGTVEPSQRDIDSENPQVESDPILARPPGSPGALGLYPRPMPSQGSKPPTRSLPGFEV